ncbi:MAG: tRNA preQ1(34) S-adenosylmethionine ribosyltransferase-isomerase QueA [Chthoniobacterales bacterium]|nr:tRNA preQ1(34) S-adenosylmethionine ribosyltransferase-isomerase QueA [Chthoniobacterales bacterium]
MSNQLSDYNYHLPPELIASHPLPDRAASRMLVLHRESGLIEHRRFRDLPEYLTKEDLLVLNDSKVIPARLHDQSGKVELLLIEKRGQSRDPGIPGLTPFDEQRDEEHWIAMVRPGPKMRLGAQIRVGESEVSVEEILADGTRLLRAQPPLDLDRWGEMPIPPYFKRSADAIDQERYQTVFARQPGSVAAPTAGLHFTPEVLAQFSSIFVTLHVGPGTFLPVKNEDLSEHQMHHERYEINALVAECLNQHSSQQKGQKGRLVAVGTTSVRVLESLPASELAPHAGSTNIFIRPPYQFQRVDALLTNFHFPKSTLLMLVSAMAGRDLVLEAYRQAVQERYRFFSYGDCMLIL